MTDAAALILQMAADARVAARVLASASTQQKALALTCAASAIRDGATAIIAANRTDMERGTATGLSAAMLDRLMLDAARIEGIAAGLDAVAALPDPIRGSIKSWAQPTGLRFERVRVPLGVIGIIYESRPNVTADAGGLCLMSGNACILRGGSEAAESSRALHAALVQGLRAAGLPDAAIQLVSTSDRAAVGAMLRASGLIDVIIPRGGKGLVARVQDEARVPVLAHLDGVNHVYVDAAADPAKACAIVINSKMRRTAVCGAAETLLIDRAAPQSLKQALLTGLLDAGCEVRASADLMAVDPRLCPAGAEDWGTEYLDAIIAATEVDGVDGAIAHIGLHGSSHTDAIVTEAAATAECFLAEVDSAIVLWNASTQYADGGEFGFGAEIGIATGRLHARGPVALEELTTYKTLVRGTGQVRP